MRNLDKEATLREVLSEVTLLDVAQTMKVLFTVLGCLGIALIIGIAFSLGFEFFSPTENSGWSIPEWLVWLFLLWAFIASYTSDKSYHEHRFQWYFPKLGWLGSIPLTLYIFAAIQLFRNVDREAEWGIKGIQILIAYLWLVPFFVSVLVLEVGHKKLMEKRAATTSSQV